MKKFVIGIAAISAVGLSSAASAHDFFLMPQQFTAWGEGGVMIQATVGSNFPTPEIVVTADLVDRLFAVGAGKPQAHVMGAGPKALNLHVADAGPGLLVTGVSTKPRDIDYAEDRIPLILGEYRVLPNAAAAVEKLPRPRAWLVSSRRFAKTFVCVRDCGDGSAGERALGTALEFVGKGPSAAHFRLLGGGKPLVNYPVDLVTSDGKRQHLATDARGDVHIPTSTKGPTMLFAAVLEPPKGKERFVLGLTSLTFSRP